VSFTITNTGKLTGSEAAQVYITLPDGGPTTPKYQLRAFNKVKDLKAGGKRDVQIKLGKYAVSFWDINGASGRRTGVWRVREGKYGIVVGSSCVDHHLRGEFEVKEGFVWEGL